MKHKLISVALIAVLLCTVLGSSIACTPTTTYTLTITSTAGGSVTPAVGTHTYDAGTSVNLTATPDSGYRFVNWTGAPIDGVEDATPTITMNGNYAITPNFALGTLITEVPDTHQPPTITLPSTPPGTSYCAPIALVNILGYWDAVMGHSNAENLTAFQQPPNLNTVAEYLGYFMDTNNNGSPARANPGSMGTLDVDIVPGTTEFVRWDGANLFLTPPPVLPGGKLGYDWTVTKNCTTDYNLSRDIYTDEIDAGRPLVVSFDYWNPVFGINFTDPESGETISVHDWGTDDGQSFPPDPEEYWYGDIGHAVTGVGYKLNWDPDGAGTLPLGDYVIVYDNWPNTPKNIAIPWNHWKCLFAVDPGP